jgi:hypothetical protein
MMGSSGSFDEDDGPGSRERTELEASVAPSRTVLNKKVDFILKGTQK